MLQNIKDNTCRVTISVKHGSLTNILDWCEKNCTENWYFTDPPHSYYVDSNSRWCWQNDSYCTRIYLRDDSESIAFSLKWI
jgi:hypothetical protein